MSINCLVEDELQAASGVRNRRHMRVVGGLMLLVALLVSVKINSNAQVESVQAASLAASSSVCEPFAQVNDDAFGLGTGADGSYAGEEGFEVTVFNDQLYIGMEADNSLGARLWRTRSGVTNPGSQADWEEIAADANGYPFSVSNRAQADHIDSLAGFNGYLYVSTANGGSNILGTRIFRSSTGNPGTWEDAIADYGPGFGDVNNMNFKDMQVFQGWLCGGTQNWLYGAQVWCTNDGTSWLQKNVSGFGHNHADQDNREIWSGYVFDNALYFGVQNLNNYADTGDDIGKLYRTSDLSVGPQWTEIYSGDPGSNRVDILGELNGYLYISAKSGAGILVLRSLDGSPHSWSPVNIPGLDGDPQNSGAVVDGATFYNDALYVGVSNTKTGFELWRTAGTPQDQGGLVDWEQVDSSGLGDPKNIYSELIDFNGSLFAWTSNYATGQQVLKSECSLEKISSPSPTVTPTPTAAVTASPPPLASPSPTATSAPTETPVPSVTITEQPVPTIKCPSGSDYCQDPIVLSPPYSVFLPLALRPSP
ncbi:MAG TPA: hypothetical protein VE136_08325 [Anaerolineales bacterium]|nr:hypothetical protein [Anaerolineales bacterium]